MLNPHRDTAPHPRNVLAVVLQYTAPASPAEYVHRVGRTARIGTQGSSLLFLTPTETDYLGVLGSHNIRSDATALYYCLHAIIPRSLAAGWRTFWRVDQNRINK